MIPAAPRPAQRRLQRQQQELRDFPAVRTGWQIEVLALTILPRKNETAGSSGARSHGWAQS